MTATVTVTVPGLLDRFTDGRRTVEIRADTVGDCVGRLVEAYPDLRPHLLDGSGELRPHLRLYHDGESVEWRARGAVELDDGDEVLLLQAVSGG